MIRTDLDHGRGWLDAQAAESIARIDRQLGRPADINDAGRSAVQADANHAAWLAYQNGGPWAPYALPSWQSVHCRGEAADSDDWYDVAAAAVWRENGWVQTARYDDDRDEPWHGEYSPQRDQHINDPEPMEDDDMIINIKGKKGQRRGGLYYVSAGKATFLGARGKTSFPQFNKESEIKKLQSRISGLR